MLWNESPLIREAYAIGSRVKVNTNLSLSPLDLICLAQNRVVLDSNTNGLTLLRCTLCGFTSTHLDGMIHHIQRPEHRLMVYEAEQGSVVHPQTESPLLVGEILRIWAEAKVTPVYVCELCHVEGITNESLFRFHLLSETHIKRCAMYHRDHGCHYFQCFIDPRTQKSFFVSLTNRNKVYDDVQPLVAELMLQPVYGYSKVETIGFLSSTCFSQVE